MDQGKQEFRPDARGGGGEGSESPKHIHPNDN